MTCSWVLNFEDTSDAGTWIVYTSQEPLNLVLSSSYELFNHVRVTVYEEPTIQLTGKNNYKFHTYFLQGFNVQDGFPTPFQTVASAVATARKIPVVVAVR
eukprot:sb/3478766/